MTLCRFFQFPKLLIPQNQGMEETLTKLRKHFPSLPQNALMKIYKARIERMRLLMLKNIPHDIRWVIEARVRLAGELSDSFISYMPGLGKKHLC